MHNGDRGSIAPSHVPSPSPHLQVWDVSCLPFLGCSLSTDGLAITMATQRPSVMIYVQFMLFTIPSIGIYDFYTNWAPPFPQSYTGLSFTSAFSVLLYVKQTLELAQALGQQNDVATLTSIFTTQSASFYKASLFLQTLTI